MDEATTSYFSSINPLSRKFIRDAEAAKNILSADWDQLKTEEQDRALDDFFVGHSVREKYVAISELHEQKYPVSFPKLRINHGEKIIVDMESDFWTWQDYHSAPFSWKSKSQQDLSLSDLDPEKLSKSSQKSGAIKKTEIDQEVVPAPKEFIHRPGESVWDQEKYLNWKEEYQNMVHPDINVLLTKPIAINDNHTEEDNIAYSKSVDDIPSQSDHMSVSNSKESIDNSQTSKSKSRSSSKSPCGSRLKLSSSFSRKHSREEQEDLVEDQKKHYPKAHNDIESNVFDNPTMTFHDRMIADEESLDSSSATSSPSRRPLLKEPLRQSIDRDRLGEPLFLSDSQSLQAESEDRELLEVTEHDHSVLQADNQALNDSSLPPTGFGFLDNW